MKIVIIGTGNVATILGKKIKWAGHQIIQVYGRTASHANQLAMELSAQPCYDREKIDPGADLYIIAISDKSLYEWNEVESPGAGIPRSPQWSLGDKLVVHTAGSVSMDILQSVSSNYGILYPLQSLRKELDPLTEIPLLIDANTTENKGLLLDFARGISKQVSEANDSARMKLHVGAVIVSNFTNHLYALAKDYCIKEQLDFSLLYPLIEETANRVRHYDPASVQTGPAARDDMGTIQEHLLLLEGHPALKGLYTMLTKSITENR